MQSKNIRLHTICIHFARRKESVWEWNLIDNDGFDANLTSVILFWPEAYRHVSPYMGIKACPNSRNISTQHLATLLGTTCCVRLATLLRCVACVWPVHSTHVATSCNNVARYCVEVLGAFGQALRPKVPWK